MRGVALFILAILILAIPVQVALAHEEDSHDEDHNSEAGEFDLHAHPTKLTVERGGNVSSMITIKPEEEDPPGTIQLTLTWDHRVPTDVSYSFNPVNITESQSSALTFVTHLDSTIGNFHFHVHATMGDERESLRMSLKIKEFHGQPDFTITASPLSLTAMQGKSASSMVVVNSLRGFSSAVDLSLIWDDTPAGVSVSFQPSTLTPSATSNLTLTTSTATPTGVYEFQVVGTSGDLMHVSPEMSLTVSASSSPPPPPPPAAQKDFTLKVSPTSWTINASETVNYNITLAAINGFNQQVTLSITPTTLTGATITLGTITATPANPPALVHLLIQTEKTLKNDTYTFTVTATNGSLTHQAVAFLNVLPITHPSPEAIILTLTLSSYNITLDDTITASGQISPPQGLANTPILLVYSNLSPVEWQVLKTVPTNSTSGYAYNWTPSQAGTFIVRAIWAGNSTNNGAFSNLAILTVKAGSVIVQPNSAFPWFWLAIAAIIIIGVATAVALRIRRKPAAIGPAGPTP